MRRLTTILAAAALSATLACTEPLVAIEQRTQPEQHEDRIEYRGRVGIAAAHAYVFDDCVPEDRIAQGLYELGSNYDLTLRETAEGVFWGAWFHRDELPASSARTLRGYIDELIDTYGNRIRIVMDVLYEDGEISYEGTMPPLVYSATKRQFHNGVASNEHLKRRANGILWLPRLLGYDLEARYEELRDGWSSASP